MNGSRITLDTITETGVCPLCDDEGGETRTVEYAERYGGGETHVCVDCLRDMMSPSCDYCGTTVEDDGYNGARICAIETEFGTLEDYDGETDFEGPDLCQNCRDALIGATTDHPRGGDGR